MACHLGRVGDGVLLADQVALLDSTRKPAEYHVMRHLRFLLAVLASEVLVLGSLGAQATPTPTVRTWHRVGVTIALVGQTSQADVVEIQRGPGGDVIAVRPDAKWEQLLSALIALDVHRDHFGDHVQVAGSLRSRSMPSEAKKRADGAQAHDILQRLPTAPMQRVGRLGVVHAITVYLPSAEMRAARRARSAKP